MKAQTIQIDSIFTADGEIFPFSPNDTIYGLSISGSVQLFSDTSLVRVILSDSSGNEWMVYEAYPMIVTDTAFDIEEECDETCYLEEFYPYSIEFQIIDATIEISSLSLKDNYYDNLADLQYQAKSNKDLEKVANMNQFIQSNDLKWIAGENELLDLYYYNKSIIFGYEKYNALGFDYFVSGIFRFINTNQPNEDYIKNSGTLRQEFDWRTKHDASTSGTPYYSSDGYGWLTNFRPQGTECGSCWVFAATASVEAVTNLYFNQHCDYDLAEKDVLCCAEGNGCDGGDPRDAINYLNETGTFNEENYPYEDPNEPPYYEGCCDQDAGEPEYILKCGPYHILHNTAFKSIDTIKTRLIKTGPLVTAIDKPGFKHAMALAAYYTNEDDYIVFLFKDSRHSYYTPMNLMWGEIGSMFTVKYPITLLEGETPELQTWDRDQDGYYKWGIGPRPQDFPCSNEQDWNDNNNRIGPCDDNFIGQPVKPEMEVICGVLNGITVNNNDLVFITGNSASENNYSFLVNNTGNAQLNFQKISIPTPPHARIVIDYQNHEGQFEVSEIDVLDTAICMDSYETFQIVMHEGADPGDLAHIIIYLDEPDISNFEFTLVFDACETQEGAEVITANPTVWSDPFTTKLQDIHIEDGASLTISGTVILSHDVDIVVAAGGILVIDGGRLTSSCDALWNGINVGGDPNEPQTLDYQGLVQVINGGRIENAWTAIETGNADGMKIYPSGGIVSCSDALLKDNVTDVRFHPYTNTLPYPYNNKVISNLSSFTKTQFLTTDDFYALFNNEPNVHLLMDEVGIIRITGCSFINLSDQKTEAHGKGIESYAAGFYVEPTCKPGIYPCITDQPSRFENLEYGIRAFNNNSYYAIMVKEADFIQNLRGMHLCLVNHPTIIKNTFDITDPDAYWPGEPLVGLYLDDFTSGFVVEENSFNGSGTSTSVGIHLLNTGTDQNQIYNNYFSSLSTGIIAVGDNRLEDTGVGLCIKCNDFDECTDDIAITPATDGNGNPIITENTGIALWQGEDGEGNDLAAGNTFSENAQNNYINDDGCRQINYVYHGINNSGKKIIPVPVYGEIDPQPDDYAVYTKIGSCPSHLGGSIILSLEKSMLTTETSLISAYEDTLLTAIDGGNTEGLNFDIITSYPEEALAIRQELIDESPFLSDTVMISAIEKEDVLPGAMIRDILVQNPQAPKSKKVMEALDQRQDSIPEYMMEEILQGLNTYGAKELLEQELGSHVAKRDQAWKNLNLLFKNDTLNIASSIDSLIALQQADNRLSTRYDLAFMRLYVEDSTNAFNVLDDIPFEFDLSSEEVTTHNQYLELCNIVWDIKHDTIGLDSLQIQILFDLAGSYQTIPGIYASNILIKERLLNYEEPVYLADPLKKSPVQNKTHQAMIGNHNLMVFPNPAGNYFIAYYFLNEQQYPGILSISDLNGRELKSFQLKNKQDQIVIPMQEFSAGVYLVRLICKNHSIDSQKLTLIK